MTHANRNRDSDRTSPLVQNVSRRGFFHQTATGIHGAALSYLLGQESFGADSRSLYDLKPQAPHTGPKAEAVIQLFMQGGPSQMDLLDPKPVLSKNHGQSYYDEVIADLTGPEQAGTIFRSPFQFQPHGQSGIEVSELLPRLAEVVDDITVIRSMHTTHPNHEPAVFKFQSGRMIPGLPTLGSWVVYGLGSENQNLPAFVVLADPDARFPVNGVQNWHSGLLPPVYQGTPLRSQGSPLLNLKRETEPPFAVAELERTLLNDLDNIHKRDRPGDLQLDARIASYQLAARMQLTATDALDLSHESKHTLAMYGIDKKQTDPFARRCLMARRLIEKGVRFVQICTERQIWDNHSKIVSNLSDCCARTDQPVAALLKDLKQRGLLEKTLVIWGGEFGRMPIAQIPDKTDTSTAGRDHNPRGFTVWMAGGGCKGGSIYGATDELGYRAVEKRVSIADWHATILYALGLNHDKLVFETAGLEEKLTSVFPAQVLHELFA